LLKRLRLHPGDEEAWRRFDALYRPLLEAWLRRQRLQTPDIEDLVQQVLEVVVRELPSFQYDPAKGRFRGWLRTILVHRLRDFWRSQQRPRAAPEFLDHVLRQLEDPTSELSRLWDQEHDRSVVARLLELVQPHFEPTTWLAFRQVLLEGQEVAGVAKNLGLTPNAVRLAKYHVLKRLRQEAAELID
jgi:RNA polymerase sigma-70 factor (ECF subfamily)